MKKFFLILLLLFMVLLAAGIVFIATLDVDRYRPQIIDQIESSLGKPVKLEKISVAWHDGFALSLQGFAILSEDQPPKELVQLSSAKATVSLAPLLSHELQVSSVYLEHPVIRLVRLASGKWEGWDSAPKSKTKGGNAAAALVFLIGKIHVEDGEIFLRDLSGKTPFETKIQNVDFELKDVALNSPIPVDLKAAVLSQHQNLHAAAVLKIAPLDREFSMSNVRVDLDLDSLEKAEIAKLLPDLAASTSLPEIGGNLDFEMNSLRFDPRGMSQLSANLHLTQGRLRLPNQTQEIRNILVSVVADKNEIKIQDLGADYSGSQIRGKGIVNLKTAKPLISFNLSLKNLALASVLKESPNPSEPRFRGMLSASFQGTLAGTQQLEMIQSLKGSGQIDIDQPVIENMNILREVFQKLSMIPTLKNTLQKNLPQGYQEKLEARDTPFEAIHQSVILQDGVAILNPIEINSESFALRGVASANLVRPFASGQAYVYVEPSLSGALIASRPELQSLADRQGILQIPLIIEGPLSKVKVRPDLESIASRVAVSAGQSLLNNLLRPPASPSPGANASGESAVLPSDPTQSPTPQASRPKLPKGKDILGALLQSALTPQDSNSSQQQRN